MTNNQSEISVEQQAEWWKSVDHTWRTYLFVDGNEIIGYGILRETAGKWWCTGGIIPSCRGKGIGAYLFGQLIKNCPSDSLWLEVLIDNERAIRLYRQLGFENIEMPDTSRTDTNRSVIFMRHTR